MEYIEAHRSLRDEAGRRLVVRNKDVLFTCYDFPAAHWQHLRTTNPIESTFATVRHRTRQTKGCRSRKSTLSMVYKLGREAEKSGAGSTATISS